MRPNRTSSVDRYSHSLPYVEISPSGYMDVQYISGKIWTDDGFKKGHIGFQDGLVAEVGDGDIKDRSPRVLYSDLRERSYAYRRLCGPDRPFSFTGRYRETPRRSKI